MKGQIILLYTLVRQGQAQDNGDGTVTLADVVRTCGGLTNQAEICEVEINGKKYAVITRLIE